MEYIAEAWDADRSLPDYGVNAFAQTPDGYLWAATYEGVARFDGVRFELVNHATTPEFPGKGVIAILKDRAGRLWAATDRGVACLEHGHWHVYRQANGAPVLSGDNLFEGQGGEILVTAGHRSFRLTEGHFVEFGLPPGMGIFKGTLSHTGDLWIHTEKQLATFHGGTWQSIALPPEIAASGLQGVTAAHDGGIWVSGASQILKFRNGTWTKLFRAPEDFSFTGTVRMLEDSERNLWCGDQSRGLVEFRPDRLHTSIHARGRPAEPRDSGLV